VAWRMPLVPGVHRGMLMKLGALERGCLRRRLRGHPDIGRCVANLDDIERMRTGPAAEAGHASRARCAGRHCGREEVRPGAAVVAATARARVAARSRRWALDETAVSAPIARGVGSCGPDQSLARVGARRQLYRGRPASATLPQRCSCVSIGSLECLILHGEPGWDRTNDHLIKSTKTLIPYQPTSCTN